MSEPAANPMPVARLIADRSRGQAQAAAKPAGPPSQPDTIGTFIALEMEARSCTNLDSLRFSITNSMSKIAAFDKAFLLEPKSGGGWRITCASSVHKIDANAPLIRFVNGWIDKAAVAAGANPGEPRFANLKDDAQRFGLDGEVPPFIHGFWLPVKGRSGEMLAALLALKEQSWRPQTVSLLIPLASAYGHAWEALQPKEQKAAQRFLRAVSKPRLALAVAVAACLAGFIPVPMSSLSPAEVVAKEPSLVTAPIDGVIADILQPPGAMVEKGTPIVAFADVNLRNDFEVAKRTKSVAQARYFKVVQKATSTQKEIEEIAIAKAELDVASSELAYAEEILSRAVIRAERSGLLIYSRKSDWVGRPVRTGERIMELADPASTELKIETAVSDAITIAEGGNVALFLDGDPLTAIPGRVTRANYRPAPNGENQLVYVVNAAFADGQPRRIGLRGVARTSAGEVPLAFYLFRRPIAALRQRFGL